MKNTKSRAPSSGILSKAFFAAGAAPVARGAPAARDQDGRLAPADQGLVPQRVAAQAARPLPFQSLTSTVQPFSSQTSISRQVLGSGPS